MHESRADATAFWIEPLDGDADLDGVLQVEAESFTNPWTRAMYAWELQNRHVCHIYVARTPACRVAGFCAFWLVFDEIHINNVAVRPSYRGRGMGTAILRHALGNALIPIVTLAGLEFGYLLGGAVLTETVFDWPGMGTYILRAVRDTEYDSIGGAILVLATIFVLVNLAVDMLYAFLDPRIRYGSAKS